MPEIIVESIVPAQNQDVVVNIPDIVVVDAPAPAIEATEIPMPPIVASDIPLEAFGFNNNNSDFDVVEFTPVEKFEPDKDFDVIEYTPVEKFVPDTESLNSDFDVIEDTSVEKFEPDNDFDVIEYTPVEKFEPDSESLNSDFDVIVDIPVEEFEPDNDFNVIEYTPVEKFEPDNDSLNSEGKLVYSVVQLLHRQFQNSENLLFHRTFSVIIVIISIPLEERIRNLKNVKLYIIIVLFSRENNSNDILVSLFRFFEM